MPKTWVVSSHAAVFSKPVRTGVAKSIPLVRLPVGVRFYFFEDEGVPLAVSKAWTIYDLVMKSQPSSQDYVALSQIPGYRMFNQPALPDYQLSGDDSWIDRHGQSASGIFMFGDEFHRNPETLYIKQGQRYSLSEFMAYGEWKPGDQVYWLACRSWM